jgi:tetratricopeptide (TPR) repeat protein
MVWALAAAVTIVGLFTLFNSSKRKAMARGFAALHARRRRNWALAARFYREGHEAAGKLKDPIRSRLESQIEIQWASVLHRQGKMREAEDLIRRGISKAKAACLPRFQVAQGYLCWGDLCADEGRFQEAEGHYRKALEGDDQSGNLAGAVFDLQRLGDALLHQERRAEAEEIINRAIVLETQVVHAQLTSEGKNPAEHPILSMSVPDLLFCREQYEDARRLYREKVNFWEQQVTRPDNVELGRLQMRLAFAEARTGHSEEAMEMYTRAEATFVREWGERHPKAVLAAEAKAQLLGARSLTSLVPKFAVGRP